MSAFFHSPSKKIAQRFWTSLARRCACLKTKTTFSNVSGVIFAGVPFCFAGTAGRALPARNVKKKLIVSHSFILTILARGVRDWVRRGRDKTHVARRTRRCFPKEHVIIPFYHGWR